MCLGINSQCEEMCLELRTSVKNDQFFFQIMGFYFLLKARFRELDKLIVIDENFKIFLAS